MKPTKVLSLTIMLTGLALAGCSMFGVNPSPPTKIEQALFAVVTNYVPATNYVTKTNVETVIKEVVVPVTNTIGQTVYNTNEVKVYTTNVVEQTVVKTNEQYTLTPKDSTKAGAGAVGAVTNLFAPGVGNMVATGLIAVLGAWGHLRSSKNATTSNALAQEVETMREFIKTLPNGVKNDAAITAFLQQHQLEAGVADKVLSILANQVSNPEAKSAVQQIQDTLKAISATA